MKKFLSLLLCAVLCAGVLQVTAFAAAKDQILVEGTVHKNKSIEIQVEDGTVTIDNDNKVITLDNVALTKTLGLVVHSDYTIIVKGNCSIGSEESRIPTSSSSGMGVYVVCDENTQTNRVTESLNIKFEDGAELSVYSTGIGIFTDNFIDLYVSGSGKLVVDSSEEQAIYGTGNLVFDGITAEITSVSEECPAIFTEGDMEFKDTNLTVNAESTGLDSLDGNITISNSNVNIKAGEFSVEAFWDIMITGEETVVNAEDTYGMHAYEKLNIDGGNVTVSSSDGPALYGYYGVTISGGTVDATSEESAIAAFEGEISITGESTKVSATANSKEHAAIRNIMSGGIYLNAYVSAENTAEDGKPFEGVKNSTDAAIEIGESFNAGDYEIYTTDEKTTIKHDDCTYDCYNNESHVHSWLVAADGSQVTGIAVISKTVSADTKEPAESYEDTVIIEVGSSEQQKNEENPNTGAPSKAGSIVLCSAMVLAFGIFASKRSK